MLWRPRKWWQASLAWGGTMLIIYAAVDAIDGKLTLSRLFMDVLVWSAAGLLFGLLLTLVFSVVSHRNLFRGDISDRGGKA